MTTTRTEPAFDVDDPQFVEEGQDTLVIPPGAAPWLSKPVFTIATLATVAGLLLLTAAGGLVVAVGALGSQDTELTASIARAAAYASAIALGLGAIGKGLYAVAKQLKSSPPDGS